MSVFTRWNTTTEWQQWVESNGGDIRVISASLKLPFESISAPPEALGVTDIARWKFGMSYYANGDTSTISDDTGNSHTMTMYGDTENSEDGFLFFDRNGYSLVNELGDFAFPSSGSGVLISCWVKSNTTNYDSLGLIAGFSRGINYNDGEITYGFVADSGEFLAKISSTSVFSLSPVGGSVPIDTEWHHLLLMYGTNDITGIPETYFCIDNQHGSVTALQTSSSGFADQLFGIGQSINPTYCFLGNIDELYVASYTGFSSQTISGTNVRFDSHIFLSPVIDTEKDNSLLSGIKAVFSQPNGSAVLFSFRASNTAFSQTDTDLDWTGFTSYNQIESNEEIDIMSLGIFTKGRYHQVRVNLIPSNVDSPNSDSMQVETPSLSDLSISTSLKNTLIFPADTAFIPGEILGQIVLFEGIKNIHKISLNLSINATDSKTYIEGSDETLSFAAANFQEARDSWVFQPVSHFLTDSWSTSNTSISNVYQEQGYDSSTVIEESPYLRYNLYFAASGVYKLWGYGFTSGTGIFWRFNNANAPALIQLGDQSSGWNGIPKWTEFGSIYVSDPGLYTFDIFLGEQQNVILDQWYFSSSENIEYIINENTYGTPLPFSVCPFNTVVRLRSLSNGSLDSLENPMSGSSSICAWHTSQTMFASGKFNYEIRNNSISSGVVFDDGLSIEFWQIGGSNRYFAAWDYIVPETSVGNTFFTDQYNQTTVNESELPTGLPDPEPPVEPPAPTYTTTIESSYSGSVWRTGGLEQYYISDFDLESYQVSISSLYTNKPHLYPVRYRPWTKFDVSALSGKTILSIDLSYSVVSNSLIESPSICILSLSPPGGPRVFVDPLAFFNSFELTDLLLEDLSGDGSINLDQIMPDLQIVADEGGQYWSIGFTNIYEGSLTFDGVFNLTVLYS